MIARLVLRRLVGPLTMLDEAKRPDFVKRKTEPKAELLDGLAPVLLSTSPTGFAIDYHPIFEGIWVSERAA